VKIIKKNSIDYFSVNIYICLNTDFLFRGKEHLELLGQNKSLRDKQGHQPHNQVWREKLEDR